METSYVPKSIDSVAMPAKELCAVKEGGQARMKINKQAFEGEA